LRIGACSLVVVECEPPGMVRVYGLHGLPDSL
jgi:hypothetical protein